MEKDSLSTFPHSLFISSQPGCKAATIRAALLDDKDCDDDPIDQKS